MIKCPNCGSTAQVRETFSNWSTILNASCKAYECGCGCLFHTREYPNGLLCGEWQIKEQNNEKNN